MRGCLLSLGCVLFVTPTALAQSADPSVGETLSVLRWTENYRFLEDRDQRSGLERIKALPVRSDVRVSFGADYRIRSENFESPFFGLLPLDDFTTVNHRFLLHSNIEFGDNIRVFAELGGAFEDGREPGPRPFDEQDADIAQLFIDVTTEALPGRTTFRIGRQESPLGSTQLFGLREGPNVRLRFDMVKMDNRREGGRLQVFYGRPTAEGPDAFDAEPDETEETWGLYYTRDALAPGVAADVFYIGRSDDDEVWNQGSGEETRHTLGMRAYGVRGAWSFDWQAAYQFGEFGDGDISAWGFGTETAYTFQDTAWDWKVGVRFNGASGDEDPADADLQTFNALYPNLTYFTKAAVLAPANALDAQAFFSIKPADRVTADFGTNVIWRLEEGDALYGAGFIPLIPGDTLGGDRNLAAYFLNSNVNWQATDNARLGAVLAYGLAGPVINDAGGDDLTFFMVQAGLRF